MLAASAPMIQWNESFSVGVETIDEQHKTLVNMLNELYEAMREGRGTNQAGNVLKMLIRYTQQHFTFEEEAMSRAGYAGLAEHRKLHRQFVLKVEEFAVRFGRGDSSLSISMLNFLTEWLIQHIQGADKRYSSCLVEHGIR